MSHNDDDKTAGVPLEYVKSSDSQIENNTCSRK